MSRPTLGTPFIATAALVWLFVAAGATPPASASSSPSTATAYIRGAHLSPDTPGVDVYLTAFSGGATRLWLASVGYGDVSPYSPLQSGLYAVSMRPHGAPASTPAALSWTLDAQPGSAYTAAAVGLHSALRGIVLHDQLNPPANGDALVRVIQATSEPARVDVVTENGPVIARNVTFTSTTPYVSLPSGTWPVIARSTTTPSVSATARLSIPADSVYSLVVLNTSTGGLAIRALLDSAGAGAAPIGAVPAGAGGTAVARIAATSKVPWTLDVLLALGLTGVAMGALGVRRTLRRPGE